MKKLALTIALTLGTAGLAHGDPHNVFGTFATESGNSHITIADCGDGSPCGTVSWIDPDSMEPGETPKTKTGDPVLGLQMLEGFKRKRKDWRSGTIYDPEGDKTYASRLKRLADGRLQVKGCSGPFCQTLVWTEVTG